MKKIAYLLLLAFVLPCKSLISETRFSRPVLKVQDPKDYTFFKLDDLRIPMLSGMQYDVSCLVYRGTERYYVEIGIRNKTSAPIHVPADFLGFNKPGIYGLSHPSR